MAKVKIQIDKVGFSVIMPTYNQFNFIRRAILSLISQTHKNWELIIINDGSTDATESFISDYLEDKRIKYIKNNINQGLGFALNQGMKLSKKKFIAYLPSDDYYYPNHLETLAYGFESAHEPILLYTTAKSEVVDSFGGQCVKNDSLNGVFKNHGLQLVQTAHRKTSDRWTTRAELVTADLFEMFWGKLLSQGAFFHLKRVTCNWSIHPLQRHKIINESLGGSVHKYRHHYNIQDPLIISLGKRKIINEIELYQDFRAAQIKSDKGLKILLVGELSYNFDRLYSLEKQGHELYGLWSEDVASWTNTGPLPFGNVINIPYKNWKARVEAIRPDIIYALLNHGAVNLAHEVLNSNLGIPFVWHFNEGPSVCIRNGYWDKLIELYHKADGKIFINQEIAEWYSQFIAFADEDLHYILDGDLANGAYFNEYQSAKLSHSDNSVHTVVTGRMIGISLDLIDKLAKSDVHIHAYPGPGAILQKQIDAFAPDHFHSHSFCPPKNWTKELSKYDAGWLHCIQSTNNNNLMLASWDDFNLPCRISTYAAANLPVIHLENEGHIVAVRNYIQKKEVGISFNTSEDLILKLKDKVMMRKLRKNMEREKLFFSFDFHIPQLITFFNNVIKNYKREK